MVVVGNPASESNFTTWKVESSWDIETFLISNRLVSYRRYPWIVVGRILLPFRCNKVQGYECSRRSWKTAFYHWHLDGTANILQNEWWMVNDVSMPDTIHRVYTRWRQFHSWIFTVPTITWNLCDFNPPVSRSIQLGLPFRPKTIQYSSRREVVYTVLLEALRLRIKHTHRFSF